MLTKEEKARAVKTACQMFGVNPPRLLTEDDIRRIYVRAGDKIAADVWQHASEVQRGLTNDDVARV